MKRGTVLLMVLLVGNVPPLLAGSLEYDVPFHISLSPEQCLILSGRILRSFDVVVRGTSCYVDETLVVRGFDLDREAAPDTMRYRTVPKYRDLVRNGYDPARAAMTCKMAERELRDAICRELVHNTSTGLELRRQLASSLQEHYADICESIGYIDHAIYKLYSMKWPIHTRCETLPVTFGRHDYALTLGQSLVDFFLDGPYQAKALYISHDGVRMHFTGSEARVAVEQIETSLATKLSAPGPIPARFINEDLGR